MPRSATLPFLLKRGTQVFTGSGMSTTTETVHGLLRLENNQLTIQWRVGTKTEVLDTGMRTDAEVGPVRQIVVPLKGVAGATVRRRWWDRLLGPRLVLTAADLSAFEDLAGEGGLSLDHPAELVLRLRRADRLAADEFGAELALAIAERELSTPQSQATMEQPQSAASLRAGSPRSERVSEGS